MRAFRHRDFRLLWTGAFLSFVGSWIQIVAQSWQVYDLTHDKALLGIVAFCGSAPVSIFGPFAGAISDTFNKRGILVAAQLIFGLGALYLSIASYFHFIRYWHIVAVALLFGFVGCVETPTRQSLVSRVVPPEDLVAAIPINGMTFNLARVVGPAIAGFMLAASGPTFCYLANAVSYLALVYAVLAIRADTSAVKSEIQPIKDLLLEGMRYTYRDIRLRTLFILEASTSMFALIYLALMPAIVEDLLKLGERELGFCYTCIGLGAIVGLLLVSAYSDLPIKASLIRWSMTVIGLALWGLGSTVSPMAAYILLAIMGFGTIAQFNLTNTLFQTLSPDRLRGRVLSMHVWALSGLGPIGTIAAGYLARAAGIPITLKVGSACLLAVTVWGWLFRRGLANVEPADNPIPA